MTPRSGLERWSWIAAIGGTIIALLTFLVSYFVPGTPVPAPRAVSPPPSTHVEQHTGSGGLQIGTVGGNVVVNPAPPSSNVDSNPQLAVQLPAIFKELGPGASVEKMKKLLGPPYAQGAAMSGAVRMIQNFKNSIGDASEFKKDPRKQYSYRFEDAYIQVRSEDGETISELMVLIIGPKMRAKISVHRTDVVLGTTHLEEILEPNEKPSVDYSSKHYLTFVYRYFGAPGNYLHYAFGNIETMNAPAPDDDGIVNFAAVTAEKTDVPYFDWAHLQ